MTTDPPRRRAITFGPLEAVEALALLADRRPHVAAVADNLSYAAAGRGVGRWYGEVQEIEVCRETNPIDVTKFGESEPRYMAGLSRTTIRLRTVCDASLGVPPVGEPIAFDEPVGAWRVRGRLIVTRCALAAPVGALATFEIEAVADGPFEIVPIGVEAPPATLAVRRAIDLVGTVLGGD